MKAVEVEAAVEDMAAWSVENQQTRCGSREARWI
jgi:hypothetical protein